MDWGRWVGSCLVIGATTIAYLPGIFLSLTIPGFLDHARTRIIIAGIGIFASLFLSIFQEKRTLTGFSHQKRCKQREIEWRLTTLCTKILPAQAKAQACVYVQNHLFGIPISRYTPYALAETAESPAPYWASQGIVGKTIAEMRQNKNAFALYSAPQAQLQDISKQIASELNLQRPDQVRYMSELKSAIGYSLIRGKRIAAIIEIISPEPLNISQLNTQLHVEALRENARLILNVIIK